MAPPELPQCPSSPLAVEAPPGLPWASLGPKGKRGALHWAFVAQPWPPWRLEDVPRVRLMSLGPPWRSPGLLGAPMQRLPVAHAWRPTACLGALKRPGRPQEPLAPQALPGSLWRPLGGSQGTPSTPPSTSLVYPGPHLAFPGRPLGWATSFKQEGAGRVQVLGPKA